jgi:hypothetical protein
MNGIPTVLCGRSYEADRRESSRTLRLGRAAMLDDRDLWIDARAEKIGPRLG